MRGLRSALTVESRPFSRIPTTLVAGATRVMGTEQGSVGWVGIFRKPRRLLDEGFRSRNTGHSGRLVTAGVADAFEGSFDELLPLLADVVIDHAHRLDGACGGTGEGKFAVGHFALIQGEGPITENDKAAVGEVASFILVEIQDNFFVCESVFRNFHVVFY